MLKNSIIQKRLNKPKLDATSLQVHNSVKKYIFNKQYGGDGTLDMTEMADDYDPLIFYHYYALEFLSLVFIV